jgi:hypothetical protein
MKKTIALSIIFLFAVTACNSFEKEAKQSKPAVKETKAVKEVKKIKETKNKEIKDTVK